MAKVLADSLDERNFQKMFIEKWDGVLPKYMGGGESLSMLLPNNYPTAYALAAVSVPARYVTPKRSRPVRLRSPPFFRLKPYLAVRHSGLMRPHTVLDEAVFRNASRAKVERRIGRVRLGQQLDNRIADASKARTRAVRTP